MKYTGSLQSDHITHFRVRENQDDCAVNLIDDVNTDRTRDRKLCLCERKYKNKIKIYNISMGRNEDRSRLARAIDATIIIIH